MNIFFCHLLSFQLASAGVQKTSIGPFGGLEDDCITFAVKNRVALPVIGVTAVADRASADDITVVRRELEFFGVGDRVGSRRQRCGGT
jgi:hypothetical protein